MTNKDQLRKQIVQYFRNIGSGQNITQCIKQVLFLYKTFNPVSLFDKLAKGKQKLIQSDIRNYLISKCVSFQQKQFKYLLKHYEFKKQITLNEFLQAFIPYNADVVRIFKAQFLQRLQIKQLDQEIQYIFVQLMQNQLKLHRSILNIREDISRIATRKTIQDLIKQDLVTKYKPRQARKHQEAFKQRNFQLGYNQLRKFLQLSLKDKDIIHEFQLLNIMRHLKSQNPFQHIILNGNKSIKKRAASANPRQKYKQQNQDKQSNHYRYESKYNNLNESGDKFGSYKHQLYQDYVQKRSPAKQNHLNKTISNLNSNLNSNSKQNIQRQSPKRSIIQAQQLKRSRFARQVQCKDGYLIIKIIEEMVKKEQRLQKLRKNLAKTTDFNLINLFKLLDLRGKGYINAQDVADFTNNNQIQYENMINFYAYEPNQLRFHQFCLIFRPLSRQLNQNLDSRHQNKVPNPFCRQTLKLILEIITVTSQMHTNIANQKHKVLITRVDLKDLFKFIDNNGKGYLTARCFQQLLTQNNIFSDDSDIKCLMKLFRKKVDQKINPQQFYNFMKQ